MVPVVWAMGASALVHIDDSQSSILPRMGAPNDDIGVSNAAWSLHKLVSNAGGTEGALISLRGPYCGRMQLCVCHGR